MLTGKAKEDFRVWSLEGKRDRGVKLEKTFFGCMITPSMQYGVYVDWFDSVGINIQIRGWKLNRLNYVICLENYDVIEQLRNNLTRPKVRTEAIKKANEIYNSK